MSRTSLFVATALIAGMALGAVLFPIHAGRAQTSPGTDTYEQLNLFGEVYEQIRRNYVEETKDKDLIEAAIDGMLTSLDPHSSYLNPESLQEMQVQTKGEFGGLGIEVTMEEGVVKVVTPIDGTPAAEAGIQPGDLIINLDGEPVLGLSLNDAVEKMRGEVGTSIRLTVIRAGGDPFDVVLKRAVIEVKSVRWELEKDAIGYIRISSFSEKTDSGLRDAITALQKATDNKLAGLVLDLRNNPGGLLDQAISVSDDFLERGEVVSTRGRDPDAAERWNAQAGDLISGKPIMVLINGGSASASEIVAGALQDHRRAVLLGTRSFGKGSVQTIVPIPNHGAIRLTTARYFTPSGRSIQGKGIDPDIVVEQAKIEKLAESTRHEGDLRGALENKGGVDGVAEPQAGEEQQSPPEAGTEQESAPEVDQTPPPPAEKFEGSEKQEIAKPDEDYQLARALDLLRGLLLVQGRSTN
jgi:carboxyl-terminal processing protease